MYYIKVNGIVKQVCGNYAQAEKYKKEYERYYKNVTIEDKK